MSGTAMCTDMLLCFGEGPWYLLAQLFKQDPLEHWINISKIQISNKYVLKRIAQEAPISMNVTGMVQKQSYCRIWPVRGIASQLLLL